MWIRNKHGMRAFVFHSSTVVGVFDLPTKSSSKWTVPFGSHKVHVPLLLQPDPPKTKNCKTKLQNHHKLQIKVVLSCWRRQHMALFICWSSVLANVLLCNLIQLHWKVSRFCAATTQVAAIVTKPLLDLCFRKRSPAPPSPYKTEP